MDKIKVSICIAVYNGEKFLHRCLNSVVNQTLKEKEIIIVNDGSTDNSLKILNEYKNLYPEITIINLFTNKGLCKAREIGVKYAKGKYIGFVDCDDYIDLKMYEKMYNIGVKYSIDIVECRCKCRNYKNSKLFEYRLNILREERNSKIILKNYLNSRFAINISPVLWLRIYKRTLFCNKNLFPQAVTSHEDEFLFPCLLYQSSNIYYLRDILYYKEYNKESIMAKVDKNPRHSLGHAKALIRVPYHIENFIGKEIIVKKFKKEFKKFKRDLFKIAIVEIFKVIINYKFY